MKVVTGTNEHSFNLEDTKDVLTLARTLGDSKLNNATLTVDKFNVQDRGLKIVFTGRELDFIKALGCCSQPNTWEVEFNGKLSSGSESMYSFEPRNAEETLFVLKSILVICKDTLKWLKAHPSQKAQNVRSPQTVTVRSSSGEMIEQFTF